MTRPRKKLERTLAGLTLRPQEGSASPAKVVGQDVRVSGQRPQARSRSALESDDKGDTLVARFDGVEQRIACGRGAWKKGRLGVRHVRPSSRRRPAAPGPATTRSRPRSASTRRRSSSQLTPEVLRRRAALRFRVERRLRRDEAAATGGQGGVEALRGWRRKSLRQPQMTQMNADGKKIFNLHSSVSICSHAGEAVPPLPAALPRRHREAQVMGEVDALQPIHSSREIAEEAVGITATGRTPERVRPQRTVPVSARYVRQPGRRRHRPQLVHGHQAACPLRRLICFSDITLRVAGLTRLLTSTVPSAPHRFPQNAQHRFPNGKHFRGRELLGTQGSSRARSLAKGAWPTR